ncbi:MAG TPA: DUF3501 family protein [Gemmataceae bacterium]|nr:DUF3501 family protein [Gemmataceae bacterium]
MKALTFDDLLPLDEFALRRRELFEAHGRYLDRYRRVRIGSRLTLLFENRQTLWFRLQEVLRVARVSEPTQVQQELDLYNRLLPRRNRLQAALLLKVDDTRLSEELAAWQDLRGEELCLNLDEARYPANLLTCRPEDRCIGTAHWVQFVLDERGRQLLGDFDLSAHFAIRRANYSHESAPLGDEMRQSLLDDLQLSDRDD